SANGINRSGAIIGDYLADDLLHGFLRTRNGKTISFDPKTSIATYPWAINAAGAIAGYYSDGSSIHGFLRSP
ncbi:MAG TPA: hypothetical protein VMF67_08670, partial [Rhizomicrobium sp.]|nr:hypothetical protein [Rhizomicrobium sp.]